MSSRVLIISSSYAEDLALTEEIMKKIDSSVQVKWNKDEVSGLTTSSAVTITTKYYRAPVEFHLHFELSQEWSAYEACLLVWNVCDKSSWSRVQDTVDRMQDHSFDVLLSIAMDAQNAVDLQNSTDWCIEHGIELVQVNKNGDNDPATTDETSGVERIVEALQCTMWKSMEMLHGHTTPLETTPIATQETATATLTPVSTENLSPLRISPGELSAAEDFDSLLQEVQSIRAKLGEGNISDDQRRERAAEAAMKLWNLLGSDGEDSDSD